MSFLRKVAETIRLILAAIRLWTPPQNRAVNQQQNPNDTRQLKGDDLKQPEFNHLPTPPDDPTELLERLQRKR